MSPNIRYERTLGSHSASVNALAISPDGTMLLSGGDDAHIFLWQLSTGERLQDIQCKFSGPITAVCWVKYGEIGPNCAFVFGCVDGSITLYRKTDEMINFEFHSMTIAHTSCVEDITFDSCHNRLATAGHKGKFFVWKFLADGTLELLPIPDVKQSYLVRSVKFIDEGASLLIFFLESHEVQCWSIEPMERKWVKKLRTRIGHVALSPHHSDQRSQTLLISNLENGVDQYALPSLERLRTYTHPITANIILQVSSVMNGSWLLVGGDNGFARLYDQKSGDLIQDLPHGTGLAVQAVTSCSLQEKCILVTSSSTFPSSPATALKAANDIIIWSHSPVKVRKLLKSPSATIGQLTGCQLFLLMAAAGFIAAILMLAALVTFPELAGPNSPFFVLFSMRRTRSAIHHVGDIDLSVAQSPISSPPLSTADILSATMIYSRLASMDSSIPPSTPSPTPMTDNSLTLFTAPLA